MYSHNRNYLFLRQFICSALITALSTLCFAIDPNSSLPIEIESDSASIDDSKGISVYQGNVIISQGETKLEADQITIKAQDRRIIEVLASGKPAHFRQQLPDQETTHGYADTIVYTASDTLLTFKEGAEFSQNNNSFTGELIEYDIAKRAIKASGNETKGERVKIQYHPNPKVDAAETTTQNIQE